MSIATNKSFYIYIISAILLTFVGINSMLFLIPALVIVPALLAKISYKFSLLEYLYTSLAMILFNVITNYVFNNSIMFVIGFSVFVTIGGYILFHGLNKKYSASKIIFILIIADMILILASLAFVRYGLNINITSKMRSILSGFYINFTKVMKLYNPEIYATFDENPYESFNVFYNFIPGIIPSVIIILSSVLSIIKYVIAKILSRNTMIEGLNFSDGLDKIRVSAVVNIVALLTFVISMTSTGFFAMIALNVFYVTMAFYILAALSVLNYKLKTKIASQFKRLILIALALIASVFASISLPVVNVFFVAAIVGFLDSIFDFRKLKTNNEDEDYEEE